MIGGNHRLSIQNAREMNGRELVMVCMVDKVFVSRTLIGDPKRIFCADSKSVISFSPTRPDFVTRGKSS